jgi:hypothetical protein
LLFSPWGDDRTLRRELMLRNEPISFLRLEGLFLAGDKACASEQDESA